MWDKVAQCVVTQADLQLQSIEEEFDGDFLGHDAEAQAQFMMTLEEVPRAGQPTRPRNEDESTAASTFRSNKKARTSSRDRESSSVRSPLTSTRRANGNQIVGTTVGSDMSVDSRLSSVESRMDDLHHMVQVLFNASQNNDKQQASTQRHFGPSGTRGNGTGK